MQGGMFKVDDDPRITPIGRFIRRPADDYRSLECFNGDESESRPSPNSGLL